MAFVGDAKWVTISTLAVAAAVGLIAATISQRRWKCMASVIRDLRAALEASVEKCASERRGRIKAQQALRKALEQQNSDGLGSALPLAATYYPMAPIGTVQSCFSNRYGTPRQPLLVPLARACVVFDQSRVPRDALEGLGNYSHCWILYVFHLNTNLNKLWEHPARSKMKAKIRVPRLKGGKVGVLATRSPHRPCPIGLSVAKLEAVTEHAVLLSGVDLVDGTPVLDIKPYLPYSDSIEDANVPGWVKADDALTMASVSFAANFLSSLSNCWAMTEDQSMYSSIDEFQCLVKEVLSWDLRSTHQLNHTKDDTSTELENGADKDPDSPTYHLVLEGVDVAYKIDSNSNVIVKTATVASAKIVSKDRFNYSIWKDMIE